MLLANAIFDDLRPTSTPQAMRSGRLSSILPTVFYRMRVGFRVVIPSCLGSPTVSLRFLDG
jgi:hypothetical protein